MIYKHHLDTIRQLVKELGECDEADGTDHRLEDKLRAEVLDIIATHSTDPVAVTLAEIALSTDSIIEQRWYE